MKNRMKTLILMLTIMGTLFVGCGSTDEVSNVVGVTETNDISDVSEEPAAVIEDEQAEVNKFIEPEGEITSGLGAVYDGVLYYAVAEGGCHTGIISRNLENGTEEEIVSNEGSNGFTSISVYDGYIYCTWDKYTGTDEHDYQIYRFSLDDYAGEYIANGEKPVVANQHLYYWTTEMDGNWEYEYATLHTVDLATLTETESKKLNHITLGVEEGNMYQGIYSYTYLEGKIAVAIEYEELGEYDEQAQAYLWKENAEHGIKIYDIDGNILDSNNYSLKYLGYDQGTSYGVDYLYNYSNVMGGGKLIIGVSGEDEVLNYISEDGTVTTLQKWMPAE